MNVNNKMNMRRDYTIIIIIIVSLNLDDAADNHIHIVGDAFIFRLRSSVSLFPSMSVCNVFPAVPGQSSSSGEDWMINFRLVMALSPFIVMKCWTRLWPGWTPLVGELRRVSK